jgi:hypothetical protein
MTILTTDRPSIGESNGLVDGIEYHKARHLQKDGVNSVCWTTPKLEITRLRLLSDPGYPEWDISYCHGTLNGYHVDVRLPFSSLPKRKMKTFLYDEVKKTGCYIEGLFSSISTLC